MEGFTRACESAGSNDTLPELELNWISDSDPGVGSSILVLVYAYAMFQKRLTMIGTRDAGQFGEFPFPLPPPPSPLRPRLWLRDGARS